MRSESRLIDINAVHVTPTTLAALQRGECAEIVSYGKFEMDELTGDRNAVGAFVHVPIENVNELNTRDVPRDLIRVLEWADANGFEWLNIDVDAPEEPELPVYRHEWDKELG